MHVLIARAPGGTTHAVSCETSAEFGARFIRTMEVQGCAVERLTLTAYAALRGLPAVPVPKGAPWAEEVPDVEVPAPAPAPSRYPLPRLAQIATRRLNATNRARRASAAAVARAALRDAPTTGRPRPRWSTRRPPLPRWNARLRICRYWIWRWGTRCRPA